MINHVDANTFWLMIRNIIFFPIRTAFDLFTSVFFRIPQRRPRRFGAIYQPTNPEVNERQNGEKNWMEKENY